MRSSMARLIEFKKLQQARQQAQQNRKEQQAQEHFLSEIKEAFMQMPMPIILEVMNILIGILGRRGIAVLDFDQKSRRIYKFKFIKDRAYALLVGPAKEEPTNGSGHDD